MTLVGEADRKMLKAAIKHGAGEDKIRHRVVSAETVSHWAKVVAEMHSEVEAVLAEEKEEKVIRQAEMEIKKGQNMIDHGDEIFSRPARTWFQTGKDKEKAASESSRNI